MTMSAALSTVLLAVFLTACQPVHCSPLQLVPLEDEMHHDSIHNTRFNVPPETTTTSRSVQAQMEEYLSDDFNLLHATNSSVDFDAQASNVTDAARNTSSVQTDDVLLSLHNVSLSAVDGGAELDNANISNSNVSTLNTKLFPDAIDGSNATIATSGLDDDGLVALPINESSRAPEEKLQPSINDLEEEDNRPSVLDFHPVLLNGSTDTGRKPTIRFRSGEPEEWHPYTKMLSTYLDSYSKEAQEHNAHCDFERTLAEDQACRFDLVYLGPSCTKENNFGYGIGKPCILLSPAKIDDWVPTAFDNESTSIPDEVHRLMRIFNSNFMFVTCEGENDSDRANIGPMAYLPPYQGFPSYFFPYKGDKVSTYVAPLMAVEFLNPTNGTLISVVCRAWARNLPDLPRQASLRFSLQVN